MNKVMAVDLGTRTIGVAVSDPGGTVALPLRTIRRTSPEGDLDVLVGLILERQVGEVVIGLPLRTDGSRGPEAEMVAAFARRLQARSGVPVYFQDERFSTREAERALLAGDLRRKRRRQLIDQTAATIILQTYLAARARASQSGPPGP